jgi:hypothetical protein
MAVGILRGTSTECPFISREEQAESTLEHIEETAK